MSHNSIGEHQFHMLNNPTGRNGPPEFLRHQRETFQRPGTNGTGVRNLGIKAPPFQMVSGLDMTSLNSGVIQHALYVGETGTGPRNIVWRGITYEGFGDGYIVLDVEVLDLSPVRNTVGGQLGSGAKVWLSCLWTLQPVKLTETKNLGEVIT